MELFFELHCGLPREGPGDAASTRKAFSMLTDLPDRPMILDIGCGPGMQTLDLVHLTNGRIIAVDNHQPFLDSLSAKVREQRLCDRIEVLHRDMFDLGFEEHTFDVIWAEGAISIIGFEKALRVWRELLRGRGHIAVTELTWIQPRAPAEIREFLDEAYPAIQDIDANLETIRKMGYGPEGHFVLPESAWWNDYYEPLEKRLAVLKNRYKDDREALEFLETEQREIDLYRRHSQYYGYVFYAAQVK